MLSKIINEIINPELASITPNFIDRYGGLTEVLEYLEVDGAIDSSKKVAQKIPISCTVDQDECNSPNERYKDLVPDETKASILYWEELNPMRFEGFKSEVTRAYKKYQQWTGKARLVVWLNAARLGIGEENGNYVCDWYYPFLDRLIRVLTLNGRKNGGDLDGAIYKIQPTNLAPKNLTIFNKYTYNKYVNYYRYPYEYFAIDVEFTLSYCIGGNSEITLGSIIDCPFSQDMDTFNNQYSMFFNGTTQSLDLGGEDLLSFTDGANDLRWSFTVWIKPTETGSVMTILSKQGAGTLDPTEEFQVRIAADGRLGFFLFSGANSTGMGIETTTSVTYGEWQMVTGVYTANEDVSGLSLYINDQQQPTTSFNLGYTGINQFNNPVSVGRRQTGIYYSGYIDELNFYLSSLSNALITQIYNNGTPREEVAGAETYVSYRMGDGASYDAVNWLIPDTKGVLSDAVSDNMTAANRTTDIP